MKVTLLILFAFLAVILSIMFYSTYANFKAYRSAAHFCEKIKLGENIKKIKKEGMIGFGYLQDDNSVMIFTGAFGKRAECELEFDENSNLKYKNFITTLED